VVSNNAIYGAVAVLGLAVMGGAVYLASQDGRSGDTAKTAAAPPASTAPTATPSPAPTPSAPAATPATPPPVPKPPATATPQQPAPSPAQAPSMAQLEQVRALVIDARRAIVRADFAAAERALVQAERIDPRSTDVIAARRDFRDVQERAARGDRPIDALITEARGAIARQDWTAAEQLLAQADQIDAKDRGVQAARAELANARQTGNRENRRIDGLVRDARAAMARQDLTEADRLLSQAEQIDPRDRVLQQARTELNDARRQGGEQAGARDGRLDPMLAEARAAIIRRDIPAAERLVAQAERIDPRDRAVQTARAALTEARQQVEREGGNSRFEPLLAEARAAIARRDFVSADRLLLQAERADPNDRDVRQTRAALNEAYRQAGGTLPRPEMPRPDNRRIDALVTEARNAIARRDYVTADRLLDQAEGIDSRDRGVQQARAELRDAQQPGWGPGRR
jgi:hypothetical protein